MLARSFHRQRARFAALFLAAGILLLALALRPLDDLGLRAFDLPIGMSAAMLVLLADAAARDGAAPRRGSLLFGCASGLLLAPALFLSGVWVRYATPPSRLYGVCYALLALLAAALAARRRQGNRRLYWLSTLGTLVPMFCALGLRWLVKVWDL